MPEVSNTNQRVTNAQIRSDIKNLSKRVGEMREELREDKKNSTQRLKTVETHVIKCATLWERHEKEHERVDDEVSDIKHDMRKWSGAGSVVGGIVAVVTNLFMDR